jgi:hypothetical protein
MPELSLKQRDRYSFELKLRYLLHEQRPRNQSYQLDLYFFLPYAFHIDGSTYPPELFYEDLKLYLRFDTPEFSAQELLDPASEASPLARLERLMRALEQDGTAPDRDRCAYEAKMLGCVYKSLLRDRLRSLVDRPQGAEAAQEAQDAAHEFGQLAQVAERFHELSGRIHAAKGFESLQQTAELIDEHLSLLFERYAISYVRAVSADGQEADRCPEIERLIAREVAYRERRGYPTVADTQAGEPKLEEYVYREKMLKRYASQILFFRIRKTNQGKRAQHVLYALAAGIAMMVATGIAFYGQTVYGNVTLSLFVLLVASYMLKDRIKDLFREVFTRTLGRRFFDRKERVYDRLRKKRLATVRERVHFTPHDKLPETIRSLRDRGSFEREVAEEGSEKVLAYQQRVQLRGGVLNRVHNRIHGVADVGVVDLERMLRYLALQYGAVPLLDAEGALDIRRAKRMYHLNVIAHYRSGHDEQRYRFRFIVDAKGIRRIEPASSGLRSAPFRDRVVLLNT